MKSRNKLKPLESGMKNPSVAFQAADPHSWKYYIVLAVIILISILVYLPVLNNGFVWDDKNYILSNELIKSISWKGFLELFTKPRMDNFAPVTDLLRALLYTINGMDPMVFHLASVLFHLVNIALVYRLIIMLSGQMFPAASTALFFAIHPLQVESVAWASGASNLICASFFLGSLISYLLFLRDDRKKYRYWALLLFILAMMSKAIAVVLPVVLLLLDYYMERKITKRILLDNLPFWILAIAVGILTIWLKSRYGNIENATHFSFFPKILFASYSYLAYLFKFIFPVHLSAFYPYPVQPGEHIQILYYACFFISVGLAACIAYCYRHSKKIFFGLAFFTVNILLVLQVIPVGRNIMADRYAYLPSIGLFFLAGQGAYYLWNRHLKAVAVILLSGFSIFFSVTTVVRCGVWKNEDTLWSDVISKYETLDFAYNNRGNYLLKVHRYEEALEDFNKLIEMSPGVAVARYNRGTVLLEMKRYEEAITDYSEAIRLSPEFTPAMFNRGLAYNYLNDRDAACDDFRKAARLGYKPAAEALSRMCK